jgi:sec-independent protein translocase protein TatA
MGNIGITEILVIGVVILLLFGAGRIADIGKGLGQGIKNFKQGIREADEVEKPKTPPVDAKPDDKKACGTPPAHRAVLPWQTRAAPDPWRAALHTSRAAPGEARAALHTS